MPKARRVKRTPSTAALLVRLTPDEHTRYIAAARETGTTLAETARAAWEKLARESEKKTCLSRRSC
jgi:hypothetical protein